MRAAVCIAIVMSFLTMNIFPQQQPNPLPAQETIGIGALIIPMDNAKQQRLGIPFDLRAYGLANHLLQNNVPLKWAIKPNKSKDDTDFTATVSRFAGDDGSASGTLSFSGGPFIVAAEYAAIAKGLITAFNASLGGAGVTVYEVTTASVQVDIRYNLDHKPLIAIGPDGGNFGTGVHQDLFDEAAIPDYTSVTDESMQKDSCYTIATQAHSTSTLWVSSYNAFVRNGGNLLLQCASINTFENNPTFGLFQTTAGYSVFGVNADNATTGPLVYPNGYMPFNQFIGELNGNQQGAISDYRLAPGSAFRPNTQIAARHTTGSIQNIPNGTDIPSTDLVATVTKYENAGRPGGYVFELGGHDYDRVPGDPNAFSNALNDINGRRMILNTLFVPVTRPCSELQIPQVRGYKWVSQTTDPDGNGLDQGDTVTWTVVYTNVGEAAVSNFQIEDILPAGIALTATGAQTVTVSGAGTSATKNAAYTGAGNNNLLSAGAILAKNGKITVTIPTTITVLEGIFKNWPTASGGGMPESGVRTDDLDDNDTVVYAGGNVHPVGSIDQTVWQDPNSSVLEPTVIAILGPSAAESSIVGRVQTTGGIGISGARLALTNATTGETRSAITNSFGLYTFEGLETGSFYVMSVSHKRYRFADAQRAFTLNDNISGFDFIANPGFGEDASVKAPKPSK